MDFSKSIGDYYLFSADQICLSVGETCGLPRANTVRPYRALGKLPYEKEPFGVVFPFLLDNQINMWYNM